MDSEIYMYYTQTIKNGLVESVRTNEDDNTREGKEYSKEGTVKA